jgi:hypothetical protein
MLKLVDARYRIQWDTFTVQDEYATKFRINTGFSIVSQGMIDLILSYYKWSGVRYLNEDGEYEIGYGIGDPNDEQGHTEAQSYAEWLGWVRNRQKNLQIQLPVINVTQSVFDALLSLYIDTGTWRTVVADEGTYDLAAAVKNENWLLVADIISRGNINPDLRKKEARVMKLGDYSFDKTRNQQITQGVQELRKRYVNGITREFDKKQAEFAYYRQLGVFLPGMSQLRQRRIVQQALT